MDDSLNTARHDARYERTTLILLGLAFGLVGLDRWMIAPLFPHMMHDLNLTYQDLGILIGILGVAWGICSTLLGRLADRVGRKRIIVGALVAFSLLSSFSGFVGGFGALLLVRVAMGMAEGAFLPTSVAVVGEAAHPSRRGFNQGLQMSMFALIGFGLAPIIVTQLLRVVPSWHWVFAVSALPGLILALLAAKSLRESDTLGSHATGSGINNPSPRWIELFKSRNVIIAMCMMLCAMSGIFVIGAMVPNYLVDYLHLDSQSMGGVMSAIGFGGFLGEFGLAGISDFAGRRATTVASFILGALSVYAFTQIGPYPLWLFVSLFLASFFALGLLGLITGPIASEAAPPGLVASAIGIASGTGEIFGGGVAPVVAGWIAQNWGIEHTLTFASAGLLCGAAVSIAMRETAPRLARQKTDPDMRSTNSSDVIL